MKLYPLHFFVKTLCLLMLMAVTSQVFAQAESITDLLGAGADKAAAEDPKVIAKENTATDDQKIRTRLSNIFSELDELDQVDVAVSNSVVTLSGQTKTAYGKTRARALAAQIDGVVDVESNVVVTTDVSLRVDSTLNQLLASFKAFINSLPMLMIAIVVVLLAWLLGRWLALHQSFFRRLAPNAFIADLLAKVAWLLVTLCGVILALSLLDATSIIGTVLGAAGIIGLAVGFAVKDTVENYVSSILLSLRNPFLIRDYVAIGDIEGSVARLTSRATVLISANGNHIRIPNSTVFKATITNYTRNPQRRFQFKVGIACGGSMSAAQQLALDTLHTVPGVLDKPAGAVLIDELGDSSVSLVVRGWIDQRDHDISKVRSEAIRLIKSAFDAAGIEMPEPAYRILIQPGQVPAESLQSQNQKEDPAPAVIQEKQTAAQDTKTDTSVEETLEEEIQNTDGENLLTGTAQHE